MRELAPTRCQIMSSRPRSARAHLRSQAHVPNVFENALELWLRRPAYGSIRVHEGEPIETRGWPKSASPLLFECPSPRPGAGAARRPRPWTAPGPLLRAMAATDHAVPPDTDRANMETGPVTGDRPGKSEPSLPRQPVFRLDSKVCRGSPCHPGDVFDFWLPPPGGAADFPDVATQ